MTQSTEIISNSVPNPSFSQGELWVAPIWSHTDNKFVPRPVVIVGNDRSNDKIGMVINFVTRTQPRNEFDVELKFWKEAGLKDPSYVRTAKPLTILKSELRQDFVERNIVPSQSQTL